MKKSVTKKKKKTRIQTLRDKCDKLLTPIVRLRNPACLLCGSPTQVAHHHVHKSKSLVLRYDIDNLINLCNKCHFKLHQDESYWASVIVKSKGLRWFNKLEKRKNQTIKGSEDWYEEQLLKLENELKRLESNQSIYGDDAIFI